MSVLSQTVSRRWLPLVLGGAAALLSGCVVAPAYPTYPAYGGEVIAGDVYAPMAPPPLQTEIIPVAPSPAYVWIGGSWGWGGGRYNWRPGRWAMPPRPGYGWYSGGWNHGPRGWHGGGGHWGPRR
ncbi:hypothetical protein [Comamonas resistens]|uniref:YXWGXW repeat-containing protein n=1 Tax=Comamonas resistens TaxID=3046670 RepID=A0ABY8SP47_9BURK|nr:hypothetical protein [Comamonas resistens]MDL5036502.1 hypothetical protein [Comamonas resistens]WHS64843.1 hypothetical protein QMY55_20500 [Comamonas resistens]